MDGFKFLNQDRNIEKNTLDYANIRVFFEQIPLFAADRYRKVSVIDRDGQLLVKGGKDNKTMIAVMHIFGKDNIEKMALVQELAQWLNGSGEMVLNFNPSKKYKAQLLNEILVEKSDDGSETYEVPIVFDLQPLDTTVADPFNFMVDSPVPVNINWPVDGFENSASFSGNGSFVVTNSGTYKSYPIIKLDGSATQVSINYNGNTITYNNLSSEIAYIDTGEYEVYDSNEVDKISNIDPASDFVKDNPLEPGDTLITVTGTGLSVEVTMDFDFKFL